MKTGGEVWVYDTLNHQIGGFSQQQGMGGSITFSSQFGTVNLSTLPVVSRNGQPVSVAANPPFNAPSISYPNAAFTPSPPAAGSQLGGSSDIIGALEKLGDLKSKGILSDQEFADKKGRTAQPALGQKQPKRGRNGRGYDIVVGSPLIGGKGPAEGARFWLSC